LSVYAVSKFHVLTRLPIRNFPFSMPTLRKVLLITSFLFASIGGHVFGLTKTVREPMDTSHAQRAFARAVVVSADGNAADGNTTDSYVAWINRMTRRSRRGSTMFKATTVDELCKLFEEAQTEMAMRQETGFSGWSAQGDRPYQTLLTQRRKRLGFHNVPNLFQVPYKIHNGVSGLGVFAVNDIKEGTLIYGGSEGVIDPTYLSIPRSVLSKLRRVAGKFPRPVIDHTLMWGETDFTESGMIIFNRGESRYINDCSQSPKPTECSLTPANIADTETGPGEGVVALRDIKAGEELIESYIYDEVDNDENFKKTELLLEAWADSSNSASGCSKDFRASS